MNKIHPYALWIGLLIGIMVMVALRHPLFGLFAGTLAVILIDIGIKQSSKNK